MKIEIKPEVAPFVAAAAARRVTCPKCGTVTDDAPDAKRQEALKSWPCRPCRAEHARSRYALRHQERPCSVGTCRAMARIGYSTCHNHRPRF